MSNNNTVPNPENQTQGHMTVTDTRTKLNRQHKAGTNLPTRSRNSITITKMRAKTPMSHRL